MRTIIVLGLIVLYPLLGISFHYRAMAGRIDPERPPWGFDLFRPELFTREGQTRRRAALAYYAVGGIVVILGLWALAA